MLSSSHYELLDFGNGRKLERFGELILDRPAPQAQGQPANAAVWQTADARFESTASGQRGNWSGKVASDVSWSLDCDQMQFQLHLTPYGQVGFFPEQMSVWNWLQQDALDKTRSTKVLNLFAYTGGSTMAAARAGADVVHVDASRTAVAWARRNADQSGLSAAPVRWIVDDAAAFVRREVRRGNRYQGFVLDPPSFGRGPRGQMWSIEKDLDQLLEGCRQLIADGGAFIVATCHTTGWSPSFLAERVRKHLQPRGETDSEISQGMLQLKTADGRCLDSGIFVYWK